MDNGAALFGYIVPSIPPGRRPYWLRLFPFDSLLESAQVKRNGYAFRQPYAWFLQRYKMLSTVTWPHWGGVAIEGVARLLRDLPISATEYAFGRRMLFIKNDSTVT